MRKQNITGNQVSKIIWDNLEEWVRRKVQEFVQSLLEEEIAELLGRQKSERRKAVDDSPGYRNGYGKDRTLTLGCGTITLRRPRVRGYWNVSRAEYCHFLPEGQRSEQAYLTALTRWLGYMGLSPRASVVIGQGCSGIG